MKKWHIAIKIILFFLSIQILYTDVFSMKIDDYPYDGYHPNTHKNFGHAQSLQNTSEGKCTHNFLNLESLPSILDETLKTGHTPKNDRWYLKDLGNLKVEEASGGYCGAKVTLIKKDENIIIAIKTFLNNDDGKNYVSKGDLEFKNSIEALKLNPDPKNLKMARIIDTSPHYINTSLHHPNGISIVFEGAVGRSIADCLGSSEEEHNMVLESVVKCFAKFHLTSYRNHFTNKEPPFSQASKRFKEWTNKNYSNFLNNRNSEKEMDKKNPAYENIITTFKLLSNENLKDSFFEHVGKTYTYVNTLYTEMNKNSILSLVHGDAHFGNLFFNNNTNLQPSQKITMIDYGTVMRNFCPELKVPYGNPAEDIGRFIGCFWLWKARALPFESNLMCRQIYQENLKYEQVIKKNYFDSLKEEKISKEQINEILEKVDFFKDYFYKVVFFNGERETEDTRKNLLLFWGNDVFTRKYN